MWDVRCSEYNDKDLKYWNGELKICQWWRWDTEKCYGRGRTEQNEIIQKSQKKERRRKLLGSETFTWWLIGYEWHWVWCSILTASKGKKFKWIWLQDVGSTPPLSAPTIQPVFIEWQSTIHRSLPKGQKQPLNLWLILVLSHQQEKVFFSDSSEIQYFLWAWGI